MNVEEQLIGSLLLDQSRYNEVSYLTSEMFQDERLGSIFSAYEHDENEINGLEIASSISTEHFPENAATNYIASLVADHDSTISDRYCAEKIFNTYKIKKFNELIDHVKLTDSNINSFFEELITTIEGLQRVDDKSEIKSISELTALKDNYFTEKNKSRLNTGFNIIDRSIGGIDAGDVLLIAARPSVGKSALALQLIRKFGRDGIKTGYFNLEMSKKQVYERSIAAASGIDLNRIRLGTNFLNDEGVLFSKGNEQLAKEKNVYVITGTQSIRSIRKIQKKYGYEVIVIDYLQLLKTEKRNSRAAEVGEISRGLKELASDFNIPVIALSQLNRVSEMNKDKEPSMSELRESGDLEQDASTILMMWNPNHEDHSEKMLKVEKSRNGTTDRVKLYFDGKHMSFSTNDYSLKNSGFTDGNMEEIPFD